MSVGLTGSWLFRQRNRFVPSNVVCGHRERISSRVKLSFDRPRNGKDDLRIAQGKGRSESQSDGENIRSI